MTDRRVAVVGPGRLGTVLRQALDAAGIAASGPHGRGYAGAGDDVVLLCVPDDAIAGAAALVQPAALLGHCSGATPLSVFGGRRGFSIHPVMTVTAGTPPTALHGVAAAVAGTDPRAYEVAHEIAERVGLQPFSVDDADRAVYHAATAMAANFEVALLESAAVLARTAGVDPRILVPLARQALANWAASGPAALTGPIARGDLATVASHREAIAQRAPDVLPLYDALATATTALVRHRSGGVQK